MAHGAIYGAEMGFVGIPVGKILGFRLPGEFFHIAMADEASVVLNGVAGLG
jgi:hypothetical protein